MDNPLAMRVVQRVGHFRRDLHRLLDTELRFAVKLVAQCLTVDERHDIVKERIGFPRIEKRKDVGMLEIRSSRYLLHESFGAEHGGEFGAQDFNRDLTVVLKILGKINRGHAALTDLTLDLVAASKCGFQVFPAVGHRELRWVKQRKLERDMNLHIWDISGVLVEVLAARSQVGGTRNASLP